MTVKSLEGRTAFITGPVQGIGLAEVRAAGAPDVIFLGYDYGRKSDSPVSYHAQTDAGYGRARVWAGD